MATANLGVRVVLDDAASGGFNALGLGVGNLIGQIGNLAWAISLLPANLQGVAVAAAGFGLAFEGTASALSDVVTAAMGLQDSMAQISVNVKGANLDMTQLQNTINNLADYSVFSSQQIADGFVLMGQKGFDAAQILSGNMGQAMTDLAESINSGPVPAAQLLTSAMQIWGASADQSTQYANILSFAFHNGVPDAAALQTAIAQAGAQAVAMGIPFQDFASILDYFGQKGLSGGQAALSLKNILISLSDPTIKAQKEMADLGIITVNTTAPGIQALVAQVNSLNKTPIQMDGSLTSLQNLYSAAQKLNLLGTDKSFYQWASDAGYITNNLYDKSGHLKDIDQIIQNLNTDLSKLQNPQDSNTAIEQLFNRTALKGGQLLFGDDSSSQKKVQELRQAMLDYASTGGVVADAATITGTAHARLKELGSTIHSTAAQIGSQFLPVIGNVAGVLNNFLNMLRTHDPALMKFIGVLLVVATAFTGVGTVVAGAMLFFGAFGEAIGAVAGPALLIAGIIAAVVVVVGFLITHWKQVQEILKPIGDLFSTVAGVIGNVVGPVIGAIVNQFGALFKDVWPELKSALGGMMSAFQGIGDSLGQMAPLWNILKIALIAVGVVVGVVLVAAFAGLVGIVDGAVHALTFIIVGIADIAKGIFGFVNGALQFFVQGWKMILGVIKALLTGHFNEIPKIIGSFLPKIGQSLLTMVQGIGNILKGAFLGLAGGLAGAVWGMFSGVFNTFGSIINKFTGLGGDTIKGLLTGLGNAGKGVADWFNNLWKDVIAKIKSWLGIQSPSKVFSDIGTQIIQGIISGLNALVGSVPTILVNLGKAMLQAVADLPGKFVDIGKQIIGGMAGEIKKGWSSLTSGLGGMKDGFVNGWKHGFGILSPSRVMAELGTFISQGMVVGIQSVDVGGEAQKHFLKAVPDKRLFTTPNIQAMHTQHSAQYAGAVSGDLTIPLQVDGKTLAQITIDRLTGKLKSQGIGRKLR